MFESVIGLAVFGFLYVEFIEFLEKCEPLHADARLEARRNDQLTTASQQ